jgi:hypothetical protein
VDESIRRGGAGEFKGDAWWCAVSDPQPPTKNICKGDLCFDTEPQPRSPQQKHLQHPPPAPLPAQPSTHPPPEPSSSSPGAAAARACPAAQSPVTNRSLRASAAPGANHLAARAAARPALPSRPPCWRLLEPGLGPDPAAAAAAAAAAGVGREVSGASGSSQKAAAVPPPAPQGPLPVAPCRTDVQYETQ